MEWVCVRVRYVIHSLLFFLFGFGFIWRYVDGSPLETLSFKSPSSFLLIFSFLTQPLFFSLASFIFGICIFHNRYIIKRRFEYILLLSLSSMTSLQKLSIYIYPHPHLILYSPINIGISIFLRHRHKYIRTHAHGYLRE